MLVYQPSGPSSIPDMSHSESAIARGNPIMLLPSTTFSWTKCLGKFPILCLVSSCWLPCERPVQSHYRFSYLFSSAFPWFIPLISSVMFSTISTEFQTYFIAPKIRLMSGRKTGSLGYRIRSNPAAATGGVKTNVYWLTSGPFAPLQGGVLIFVPRRSIPCFTARFTLNRALWIQKHYDNRFNRRPLS
jgi:hypothetical protein